MTSYMNILHLKDSAHYRDFEIQIEVSSPSNSIVIESERFYMTSRDSNPTLPV